MKNLLKLVFIFAAFLVIPGSALAQSAGSYSAEYLQNPTLERGMDWWKGLQKEVNLSAGSYKEVKVSELQRVIHFATHYGESIDFRASVPRLVHVYRFHDDVAMRMMALAALARIGDADGMEALRQAVRDEESPRLRRMTAAALKSYNSELAAR